MRRDGGENEAVWPSVAAQCVSACVCTTACVVLFVSVLSSMCMYMCVHCQSMYVCMYDCVWLVLSPSTTHLEAVVASLLEPSSPHVPFSPTMGSQRERAQ